MISHAPENYICPFCEISDGKDTSDGQTKKECVFYSDSDTVAFISSMTWPHNAGNVLVIPRQHFENIYDISSDVLSKTYITAQKVAIAMKEFYKCDAISMRQHNEPYGNQSVWHFHVHVLPRYKDDNLYLNHNNKRIMSDDERKKYADLLKKELSK